MGGCTRVALPLSDSTAFSTDWNMLIASLLLLISRVYSQAYCSSDSSSFCMFGYSDGTNITYTIYSKFKGYVAMGIGNNGKLFF